MCSENSHSVINLIHREAVANLHDAFNAHDEMLSILLDLLYSHIRLATSESVVRAIEIKNPKWPVADVTEMTGLITMLLYSHSMTKIPERFIKGMGEDFVFFAGFGSAYAGLVQDAVKSYFPEHQGMDPEVIMALSSLYLSPIISDTGKKLIDDAIKESGLQNPTELLVKNLVDLNIPILLAVSLTNQSDKLRQEWFANLTKAFLINDLKG